jgi:hypothetical protein
MGFPEAVRDYPGRLTVPTAVRSAGYIPFWWHPLTYSRHTNLGETGERGCVEEVLIALDWSDYDAFLVYAHRANADHLAGTLSESTYEGILYNLEQIARYLKAAIHHAD